MNIRELLNTDRVVAGAQASSKKRALEAMAQALASACGKHDELEIFDHLLARERLGSTGLGHGVSIPHARLEGLDGAIGALIKLDQGVDFDARDQQPVDLMFGLMVPASCTEEHLKILASLAQLFSDENITRQLRDATNSDQMIQIIDHWNQANAA